MMAGFLALLQRIRDEEADLMPCPVPVKAGLAPTSNHSG